MNKTRAALIAASVMVCSPVFPTTPEPELEVVLVTGEQPGPGLWKVSRDEHVMWVLGSIGEVPGAITWRTQEVEARIAESQEVLYSGGATANLDIGVFRALTLVPAAFKAAKNPNGGTLKDVLTPETYARWLRLKQRYLGDDDDIEKYRPMFAEEKLGSAMGREPWKRAKFVSIDSVVDKAARKHRVRIHRLPTVIRKIEVENPKAILKAARNLELAEGECFGRRLRDLEKWEENGLPMFDKNVVNAWATGNLDVLRNTPLNANRPEDCMMTALNYVMNRPVSELPEGVTRGIDLIKKQEELSAQASAEADLNWLEAAEQALAKNPSTFAVLPINNALSPTGYLAKLVEKGYAVEEPR
jgi:hypothetical protein